MLKVHKFLLQNSEENFNKVFNVSWLKPQ